VYVRVQLIFAEQCTEAHGHCYHVDHYVCTECQCPLAGNQYVMLAGRPYCTTCFHSVYADYCCTCGLIIAIEQRHVVHENRKWHDSCFRCEGCGRALVGRACLLIADGRVFCSGPDCTNQRQDKLLPVDDSRDNDDVTECEEVFVQKHAKQRTLHQQQQQQQHQLSDDKIRLVSRQTTV